MMERAEAESAPPQATTKKTESIRPPKEENNGRHSQRPQPVGLRYLYADSEPFPYQYDFLSTFQGFIQCAAHALRSLSKIEELERGLAERSASTARALDALDGFVTGVAGAANDALGRVNDADVVKTFAEQLRAYIERQAADSKTSLQNKMQKENSGAMERIDENWSSIRQSIGDFLIRDDVDAVGSKYSIRLAEGGYVIHAECAGPGNIEVSYRLATDRLSEWNDPRKVASLVGSMELQVGLRRKWLTKDVQREVIRIDDLVLSEAKLGQDEAEIHLRKKSDVTTVSIVLVIRREKSGLTCEIRRPSDRKEPSSFQAVPEDLGKIERLWRSLRNTAAACIRQKEAVQWVRLDGEDIFERNRVLAFLERLIELYAPVISEIARRSPSPRELSLKVEHDDGRREEKYVRKEQLAQALTGLDDRRMKLFERLDIFPSGRLSEIPAPRISDVAPAMRKSMPPSSQ